MKHRIQNSEHRTQPRHGTSGCARTRKLESVKNAPRGEDVIGGGEVPSSLQGGPKWEKVGWRARILSAFIGSFHVLTDIIAQNRPVITRFLAYYRSEPFSDANWFFKPHEIGAPVDLSAGAKRGREKLRIVTHCYAKFHESARKFAQIRPVNPRCYALLRVRPFF